MKPASIEDIATKLIAEGAADCFRLMSLTNQPSCCAKHPLRYTATIATIANLQYSAVGWSPVDAVAKSLCQEKVFRQGWSDGDVRG